MNTGQTLLTICAMVLLGVTVLTVNRNSLNNGTILRQTELGIYAVSLATSYIQRASGMDFDERSASGLIFISAPMPQPPTIPAGELTSPDSLGPDKNETKNFDNTYDDFDDYNTFVKDTVISDVDIFHVTASVYYIDQATLNKVTTYRTWMKRMDIGLNNSINRNVYQGGTVGTDTIKMSYIMAYYK
jgi:hypothetical protein